MDVFDEQEPCLYSRDVRNQAQDGTDEVLLAMGLFQDKPFSLIVFHQILARIGGSPALSIAALRQIDAAIAGALPKPPNAKATARAAPRVRATARGAPCVAHVVRAAKRVAPQVAQPEQPQRVEMISDE